MTFMMVAVLVAIVVLGGLIYIVTVSSVFDPKRLTITAPDGPDPAAADSNAPVAGDTTQRSAVPDAATDLAPSVNTDPAAGPAITINSGSDNGAQPTLAMPQIDQTSNPGSLDTGGFSSPTASFAATSHDVQPQRNSPSTSFGSSANSSPSSTSTSRPSASDAPSYLSLVRAGRSSLASNDLSSAYRAAAQAKALDPNSVPALELMQTILARSGSPRDAEASAHDAIAHGGKAVFELQHVDPARASLHPAKIAITATSLQFQPEGADSTGSFTIPLSSITAVQMRQNAGASNQLSIQFNKSAGARGANGELSFRVSPKPSTAQETAHLAAIRNVLLASKGRP